MVATITTVSIGTGNKVSVDYQSQEVNINVTYELERSDTDLNAFLNEKAQEVEAAHSLLWRRIRELRTDQKATDKGKDSPAPPPAAANGTPPPAEGNGRRRSNGKAASSAPVEAAAPPESAAPGGNGAKAPVPVPVGAPAPEMLSPAQQRAILSLANRARMSDEGLSSMLGILCGKTALEQLTKQEAAQVLVELQRSGS